MKKKNAHISPFTKDSQSVIRENLQKLKRILIVSLPSVTKT